MAIVIAPANLADRSIALAVLTDAARRQAGYGCYAWTAEDIVSTVDLALAQQELVLAWRSQEAAGACVLQWTDPRFWGEQPDDAGYLHALAVREQAAGQRIGLQLVAWAEAQVRERGRRYLRLDCDADNQHLNEYYVRAGFTSRGVVPGPAGGRVHLYEKRLV